MHTLSGISTTLDGNVLKASIKDRQLQVVGSNAEVYDLTAFEKENTDKIDENMVILRKKCIIIYIISHCNKEC